MTLNQAIKIAEKEAKASDSAADAYVGTIKANSYRKMAKNYRQLVGWLEELKEYRKKYGRTVDITKKSNIKCEHCKYWNKGGCYPMGECKKPEKNGLATHFWNRCKYFEWRDKIKEDNVK